MKSKSLLKDQRTSMGKRINLYWYKHPEGHGNFGDELNPYIVRKLTGREVDYIDFNDFRIDSINYIKTYSYQYLKGSISFSGYIRKLYYYFIARPAVLVGIGSILEHINYSKCIVWGSGMIEKEAAIQKADFRAVRGKYTQCRLKKLGYEVPDVLGDPAILLPLLYKPEGNKKYRLGIIPHHRHYDKIRGMENEDIIVINLLDPIEKIINEIWSCENTLSSSLHGIIVSHAYGIPSVWYSDQEKKLYGDDTKFRDYFSSVNLEDYNAIPFEYITKDVWENLKFIESMPLSKRLPRAQIVTQTQMSLIKAFPFDLERNLKDIHIKWS